MLSRMLVAAVFMGGVLFTTVVGRQTPAPAWQKDQQGFVVDYATGPLENTNCKMVFVFHFDGLKEPVRHQVHYANY